MKTILATLVLALVLPQVASSTDFTFNTKVNLTNLHQDVKIVKVACRASAGGRDKIGSGSVDLSVPANGVLNQNVKVAFNADSGKNPADAKTYFCDMRFGRSKSDNTLVPGSSCNQSALFLCATPGKPLKVVFNGTIP